MLELCLNELALAVVCHVLDKLSDPAMEVFLSRNELAVYQLLVRDLHLFITKQLSVSFLGTNPIRMVGLYITWGLSFSSR